MRTVRLALLFTLPLISACHYVFRPSRLRECKQREEWCSWTVEAARDSWLYSQLAENAYRDSGGFSLPSDVRRDTVIAFESSGFAASVFSVWKGSERREVIIAFRGTEFTQWRDWRHGNFGFTQNNQALVVFDSVRTRVPDTVPIVVTGHSLGGAMATSVSLRRSPVTAYVFNTSSHFTAPRPIAVNERYSVASYGEILKGLRLPSRNTTQTHTVIPCVDGNIVQRHSQRALAACLTQIAALTDSAAAASLRRNSIPPRPRPFPYPAL